MRMVLVRVQPPQPNFPCSGPLGFPPGRLSFSHSHFGCGCRRAVSVFLVRDDPNVLPPMGMVHWVWFFKVGGGSEWGEDHAGPALNPLKGSSARLPPYGSISSHAFGQTQAAENTQFSFAYPGKKAMPPENFPGKNFACRGIHVRSTVFGERNTVRLSCSFISQPEGGAADYHRLTTLLVSLWQLAFPLRFG